jgi:hypothetical protein
MRAFTEDPAGVLTAKIISLALGAAFIGAGVIGAPLAQDWRALLFMALGCYVTAASLVGLRRGAAAWTVYAPAGFASFAALAGLAIASALTA